MDQTLLIFLCIALGAATVLFVVLAMVALRVGKDIDRITIVAEEIKRDVNDFTVKSRPMIEKAGLVLDQTRETVHRLNVDLEKLSVGIDNITGITHDIRLLEQNLLARVKPSLEDLASLVSGVARGVTVFARKLIK